jgi:hypothetical protein
MKTFPQSTSNTVKQPPRHDSLVIDRVIAAPLAQERTDRAGPR